jgi:ADP-heptose:LPS heptosyltransferase
VVVKNLAVLPALGAAVPARPRFPIDVPFSPALEALRPSLADAPRGHALVNPGAAWPNKRWPADRFGAVAAALRRDHGLAPVVCWGPGEEALAAQVAAASGGVAIVAPPTGIGDLVAIAHGASVAVSGDTGPLHLAAAAGAPVVAVFGPTDPARNGPWSAEDVSLSRFAACVCHYERRCRRERPCIEEITVEDVLGAIERRLAIAGRAQA